MGFRKPLHPQFLDLLLMCQPASANQVILEEFTRLCSCSPTKCIISSLPRAISDHRLVGRYSLWKSFSLHCLSLITEAIGSALLCICSPRGLCINLTWGFRVLPLSGSWTKRDAHFQRLAGEGSPAMSAGCSSVPMPGLDAGARWAPSECVLHRGFAPCDFSPTHKS